MLTRTQNQTIALARTHARNGQLDAAARSLSALHRCAMRATQRAVIRQIAQAIGADQHPDFII